MRDEGWFVAIAEANYDGHRRDKVLLHVDVIRADQHEQGSPATHRSVPLVPDAAYSLVV